MKFAQQLLFNTVFTHERPTLLLQGVADVFLIAVLLVLFNYGLISFVWFFQQYCKRHEAIFLNVELMRVIVSRKLPVLIISCLLALLILPSVAGEPAIYPPDGNQEVDITAGQSLNNLQWVIYNPDDTMYLIEVDARLSDPSVGTLVYEKNYKLPPNSDNAPVEIPVNVHIREGAETSSVKLIVTFSFQDLSNIETEPTIQTKEVTLNITSLFSSVGNTIFGWENTLPAPFNSLIWTFIITMAIWLLIGAIVYFIIDPLVERFTLKTKNKYDNAIYDITRIPIFLTIVLYGFISSVNILSISNDEHLFMRKLVTIVFIVLYTVVAYRIFDRVLISLLRNWSNRVGSSLGSAIVPILHFLGMILIPFGGITVLLNSLGIDIALLLAGVGVGATIVTLAAKDVFSSFFAGVQVMLDRPFKMGDRVMLDSGEICEVKEIGVRSTQLYNLIDHEIIIIPNTMIAANKITNYSEPDNHRCLSTSIGVAYGTDVKKVEAILLEIANNHPDVVHNDRSQAPFIRFSNFGNSSLDFTLWYYVNDIKKMWRVNSEIKVQINNRFNEEGIEIPFPQNVVTFNNQIPGERSD